MKFHEDELRRHRRNVGVVFLSYDLFPHLTALQNIMLPLEKVHRHAPSAAQEIAMQLLGRFQLETHAAKRPAALPGGQRQRGAIARAIAIQPRVLLFDEPTSALDPEMTAEILDMIRELSMEARDLIFVTHEMGFARAVADRVAFLGEGRILECGEPDQIFSAPSPALCRRLLSKVLQY